MPRPLTPEKADALEELVRRGALKGERAEAARELVRRTCDFSWNEDPS